MPDLITRLHEMTEEEVRAYARTLPQTIEERCSRDVYYLSHQIDGVDGVLKLASDHERRLYTYDQNLAEAILWKLLPSEHRTFFAAILAHADDGLWLLQERVEPLWGDVPEELEAVAERYGVADLWPWNCGLRRRDGIEQPVILDYGQSRTWERITGGTCLDLIPTWKTTYLASA